MLFGSSGYLHVASPHRLVLAVSLLLWAGDADGQTPPVPVDPNQPRVQEPRPAPSPGEVVVVTASRLPELLINAPATMTVITDEAIRNAPSQSITDLLRLVPGMNAVQAAT